MARANRVSLLALLLLGCPGPELPPSCIEGQACTPATPEACRDYATTCTADVSNCVEKSTLADGASCGVGVVCSAGACIAACEDDAVCTPTVAAPCKVHRLTCNPSHTAGTCAATGNAPEGTVCGAGLACAAGECVTVSPVLHSISGVISGALVANVQLTLSGAASAISSSQANGSYSFAGLADGSYTVTPAATGATFSPTSATVALAGADATASFTSSLAQLTLFSVPGWPSAIITGGDGNLWVSDTSGYSNKILRLTPAGVATVFTIPATDTVGIAQLAPFPGGIVFTEARAGKVGVMRHDGTHHEWPKSKAWVNPVGIVADAAGYLWVSEPNPGNFPAERMDRVARYSNWASPTLSATVDDYAMRFGGYAPGLMALSVGLANERVYFTIGGRGAVGWIEQTGQASLKEWDLTGFTKDIVAGPNASMWFTEPFSIGAITHGTALTAVVTHYPIPSVNPEPDGITIGADGNVWFAETRAGKLGRLNPATGVMTEYPLPGAHPIKLTRGPDGNLWFTTQEHQVGRFIPP
ncbi:MAG: SMP-30/gluconolactonase/LRE family protein [Myxococcales bacterium]|nr:SMP-30/gluconolactonase/LRE family protein [Myxococcales bacterium]